MARLELTNKYVEAHPAPEKEIEIYDSQIKNLAIRIYESGTKSFVYRYFMNGNSKRFTIGRFPNYSVEQARIEAQHIYKKVQKGVDPIRERKRQKRQNESISVRELINKFKEIRFQELRDTTIQTYRVTMDNYLSDIHNIYLSELSKKDVIPIMDNKFKQGSPVMANQIREVLSVLLSFAESRDLIEENFATDIQKFEVKNSSRERYYNFDEIIEIWEQIETFKEPSKSAYKILFYTAQRKTETLEMRWKYLDSKKRIWTIPAHLAKNNTKHVVPLTESVMDILEHLKQNHSANSDYVFKSNVRKNKPIKTLYDYSKKIKENTSVSDFRNHDIRRTVVTHMADLEVPQHVAGKVINHIESSEQNSVTAIYNKHEYLDEKRVALEKWSHKLNTTIKKHRLQQQLDELSEKDRKSIKSITYLDEDDKNSAVDYLNNQKREELKNDKEYSF